MKCINFDEQFQQYMLQWVQDNGEKYKDNYDRMEAMMPEVYFQWLNMPATWLDGETPGTYFAQFDDVSMLVAWMRAYFAQKVAVPDQLLERITAMGSEAEQALVAIVQDDAAAAEVKLTAISMLSEMESLLPMAQYVAWIGQRGEKDERADLAAEALVAMGSRVVDPVLAAVQGASAHGRETFLDILCNFPGEEEIYRLAAEMFESHPDQRALYASLLGKLGDDRALPMLLDAIADQQINYLDYIEIRNAIEALGGEPPAERAFDGDPYYEALRG